MQTYVGSSLDSVGQRQQEDIEGARRFAAQQAQNAARLQEARMQTDAQRYGADRNVDIAKEGGSTQRYMSDRGLDAVQLHSDLERFKQAQDMLRMGEAHKQQLELEHAKVDEQMRALQGMIPIEKQRIEAGLAPLTGSGVPAEVQSGVINQNVVTGGQNAEATAALKSAMSQHELRSNHISTLTGFGHIIGFGFGGEMVPDANNSFRFVKESSNKDRQYLIAKLQQEVNADPTTAGKVNVEPITDSKGNVTHVRYVPVLRQMLDPRGRPMEQPGQQQPAPQVAPQAAPKGEPEINPATAQALSGGVAPVPTAGVNAPWFRPNPRLRSNDQPMPNPALATPAPTNNPRQVIPQAAQEKLAILDRQFQEAGKGKQVTSEAKNAYDKARQAILDQANNIGK